MTTNNCIDIYDIYITNLIQSKFNNTDMECNFQFAPSQFAFSSAKENFPDKIFPLYNVYRTDPPQPTSDYTSYANQNVHLRMNDSEFINHLMLDFTYDIDFFSENMFDMNKSIIDFYKFKSAPSLTLNFKEIGIDVDYLFEAKLDPPEANHNIDQMLESGIFFRYTYKMTCRLPILEISHPVIISKINFSLVEAESLKVYYEKQLP